MKVILSPVFAQYLKNYPKTDREIILAFINHVEQFGFDGLQGRNKSSDNVPTDDPNWLTKVKYAQQYQLWHYHIGIPYFTLSEQGDYVSEYVLHYTLGDDEIVLIDLDSHPPFNLPKEDKLMFD